MIGVRGTTSWAGFMCGASRQRFFSFKIPTTPSSVTVQWQPDAASVKASNLTRFANQVATKHGLAPFTALDLSDYRRLHRWSVENPSEFWRGVWDYVGFVGEYRRDAIVEPGNAAWAAQGNPSPRWFPGASVNHAENLLAHGRDSDTALIFASENSHQLQLMTYKQLRSKVGRLAAALAVEGVGPGDCCAGYVSNTPDAVVAMLAVTSLGASWATCSPDFGERGVLERLGQVTPKVLFVHDCYYYRGKRFDMAPKVNSVARELASTKRIIVLDYPLEPSGTGTLPALPGAVRLQDYIAGHEGAPLKYRRGSFDRAVYIMFSSGTTGAPKCMVQGCGVTLNHNKEAALHFDINSGQNIFWFTTTGWMMWQWLIGSALGRGAAALLYDGDPFHPTPSHLWQLASEAKLSVFGTSARWLSACSAHGEAASPNVLGLQLPQLRIVGSTGSPAGESSFSWVSENVRGQDGRVPQFVSTSGGTDLNGSFVGGIPWLPVHAGELQGKMLGMDVTILDETGSKVLDTGITTQPGELCCRIGFPSAPLYFLGDGDEAERYRSAYFSPDFAGGVVWRHGDFSVTNPLTGGVTILGRSDATLNPGGVRIGTAELYRALDQLAARESSPPFIDTLVVGQPVTRPDGTPDVRVVLFLKLAGGHTGAVSSDLVSLVRSHVRAACSPRHVPAVVCAVPDIPYTANGKKVEIAVLRALTGRPITNRSALANPSSLDFFETPDCLKLLDEVSYDGL